MAANVTNKAMSSALSRLTEDSEVMMNLVHFGQQRTLCQESDPSLAAEKDKSPAAERIRGSAPAVVMA